MADARVFVNNGTGTLAAGPTLTGVTGITSVLLVDADGDRKLDVVLGGATVAVFSNTGDDTTLTFAAAATVAADRGHRARRRRPRRRRLRRARPRHRDRHAAADQPRHAPAASRTRRRSGRPRRPRPRSSWPTSTPTATSTCWSRPPPASGSRATSRSSSRASPSSSVEVALTATGSTDLITINDGNGAFLLTAEGIAGQFSGDVKAGPAGFSVGASMSARINTTTRTFDETIEVGGTTIAIKFVAGEVASGTPLKPFVKFSG